MPRAVLPPLGLHAHRSPVHRISQPVALQRILQRQRSELRPRAHPRSHVRCIAHRLLATGDDHLGITDMQQTRRGDHGVQTRQAHLVHCRRRGRHRHTGSHRRLLRRVLPRPCLHDLTHDHVVHRLRGHPGAFQGGTDDRGAEIDDGLRGQGAEHLSLGGARGTDNNDVLRGGRGVLVGHGVRRTFRQGQHLGADPDYALQTLLL